MKEDKAEQEREMDYKNWSQDVCVKIREKMSWSSEKNRDKLPYTTDKDGNYVDRAEKNDCNGTGWWTNGFWGGLMWLLYRDTKDEKYKEIAQNAERRLDLCFDYFYALNHDTGFLYMPTAVADYRLTGSEESRKRGLHAATLLAGRFNPAGRFIRAWDGAGEGEDTRGWAIIDCMCNLSLLYWASEETGDPRFRQIATMHADTMLSHAIRRDGSVKHIMEFNPETGEYIRSRGGQGYGYGSAWSRGQGWAVYGFMISYFHTKKKEYFRAAKKVADYCLEHIPESGLVPVDFCQPEEIGWEDSCGAAVIAGGLLSVAQAMGDPEAEKYRFAAWKILNAIYEKRSDFGCGCDAIVQNCTAAYHDKEHHFPMNYADYYFVEGVYRLAGMECPW